MNARLIGWILALLALVAVAGITYLFWVQNSARRVMLSLNLVVTKLQLVEPMPVPVLMALCFGVGLLVGVGLLAVPMLGASSRARKAEQRAALSASDSKAW